MASKLSLLATVVQPPTVTPQAPGELSNLVGTVLNLAAWAGTAAGVAGVLVTGAMMAISFKRGEGSEHMGRLGLILGGCVLVASAGPLVNFVFTPAAA
ncbi:MULTISPECIES: hypothetical protein [Streptomyces]|uniref:Conjugal transfer protein TrbC n=1 Tax=Streptomyces lichenis TaxID=2306967 RepID=A0ABT0IA59_9ACTN|nr:hypothetical protein [Streptomyces lichenis]MCK8678216.1 hypothetical protein [Streptomyces lichenis]